jgi:hypothetical protein
MQKGISGPLRILRFGVCQKKQSGSILYFCASFLEKVYE